MKYCPRCGAACDDSAKFCVSCGAKFPDLNSFGGQEPDGPQGNSNAQNQWGSTGQNGSPQNQWGSTGQNSSQQNQWSGYSQNGGPQNQWGSYGQNNGQWNGYEQGNGYGQFTGRYQNSPYAPTVNTAGIRNRSIVLAIVFSIITFGIYGIYWMIKLNDDINQLADEPEATSGGMVFLFTLITLGIYGLYWLYRMGERNDKIQGDVNGSSKILFLILGIVGFSIIAYALLQNTINKCLPYGN